MWMTGEREANSAFFVGPHGSDSTWQPGTWVNQRWSTAATNGRPARMRLGWTKGSRRPVARQGFTDTVETSLKEEASLYLRAVSTARLASLSSFGCVQRLEPRSTHENPRQNLKAPEQHDRITAQR